MTMDDNYIMAENMRQLAEEAPSLHKQINILQKKLEVAEGVFEGIKDAIEHSESKTGNIDAIWLLDYVNYALDEIEKTK
jgi:hypothetical protein